MKQMLSIVAITVLVVTISSCKATTEQKTDDLSKSANSNTAIEKPIPSTSGDKSSPNAKEKDALRLLGRSGNISSGANLLNPDGSLSPNAQATTDCFLGAVKELDKVLGKDIADNLRDVVTTFSEKCPQATPIIMDVEKNPDIQEVQAILGKEDATMKEKITYQGSLMPVQAEGTYYRYAGLDFGVVKGKVVALRTHIERMK